MNYVEELNDINTKLSSLESIKNDLKTAIEDAGQSVTDVTFLGLANSIYNIATDEFIEFVNDDSDNYKNAVGFIGLKKKAEYISKCNIYIKNAIIARGIEVSDSIKFSEYKDLIGTISSTNRLPIIELQSEIGTLNGNTKIVISTPKIKETNVYKYKYTNVLPLLGSEIPEWFNWDGKSEITVNNYYDYICIAECDTNGKVIQAGFTNLNVKEKNRLFDELYIETEPGNILYSTKIISVNEKLDENNIYYYANYDSSEVLYLDDFIPSRYTQIDESFIIELDEYYRYADFILVETTSDGQIKRFGTFNPDVAILANSLVINSQEGTNIGYTNLFVYSSLSVNNKYFFITRQKQYILNESIDPLSYTEWDGESEIKIENDLYITLVEVNNENKVQKFGFVKVKSLNPNLKDIIVESVAGDNPYESIINIIPEKTEGSKYYYKETSDIKSGIYGTIIDTSSYTEWDGESEISIKNGTRIVMIETIDNKLIGLGYSIINSNVPVIKNIILSSVYGENSGTTHVSILTDKENEDNFYVYLQGNHIVSYGTDVSTWVKFDFENDITGLLDGSVITVVECGNSYRAEKVGMVSVMCKPVELFVLVLDSWRSSKGGCTKISISPYITEGNKYKYKFTDVLPELYEDLSDWNDYSFGDDIPAVDGETICVVECDSNNRALKAGTVIVSAKEPDPVLGNISVSTSVGTVNGYTKVTIEEPLTDGYEYVYKLTSILPEYHDLLNTWLPWDGVSEISATNGSTICIAEVTSDKYAYRAGTTKVYSL